jgi:uncharacterized protein YneF (UPF0154 family)
MAMNVLWEALGIILFVIVGIGVLYYLAKKEFL